MIHPTGVAKRHIGKRDAGEDGIRDQQKNEASMPG